jgi:hypothetical protein
MITIIKNLIVRLIQHWQHRSLLARRRLFIKNCFARRDKKNYNEVTLIKLKLN